MTPEELNALRNSLSPLLAPPTQDEVTLRKSYLPIVREFKKILDPELKNASNVGIFSKPSSNSEMFWKSTDTMSWWSYCRLASPAFISDEPLLLLMKYTRHLLSPMYTQGVHFVKLCNTSPLMSADNKQYVKGGSGFGPNTAGRNRDYTTYFGKDTKSLLQYRSIFFPFFVHGNHYVGAIVHPRPGKVFTFDTLGVEKPSHDEVFEVLNPFLNHALIFEGEKPIEWMHFRLDVPLQDDSISCGLFQILHGVILAVVDDPSSSEVKDILFCQDEILTIREKFSGFVLANTELLCRPHELMIHFQKAKETLEETKAGKKLASSTALAQKPGTPEDLTQSSDDEAKDPNDAGGRLMQAASTSASKKEESAVRKLVADAMRSMKQNSQQTTVASSFSVAFDKALSLSSRDSFNCSSKVKQNVKSNLLTKSGLTVLLPAFGRSLERDFAQMNNPFSYEVASWSDDSNDFTSNCKTFIEYFNDYCEQVICMVVIAKEIWAKLGDITHNESFGKAFAQYFLDTLVAFERASLVLDHGMQVVKADENQCFHYVDLLLEKENGEKLKQRYPSMDVEMVQEKLSHLCSDLHRTIDAGLNLVRTHLVSSVSPFVTVATSDGVVSVTYSTNTTTGQQATLEKQISNLLCNSDEFLEAHTSYPQKLHLYDFRIKHLLILNDMCTKMNIAVPLVVRNALQVHFNETIVGQRLKSEKKVRMRGGKNELRQINDDGDVQEEGGNNYFCSNEKESNEETSTAAVAVEKLEETKDNMDSPYKQIDESASKVEAKVLSTREKLELITRRKKDRSKIKKQSKLRFSSQSPSQRMQRSFVQSFAGQDVITPFVNEDQNARRRKNDSGATIHDNLCYNLSGVMTLKVDLAPIASKSTVGSNDKTKQIRSFIDDEVTRPFEVTEAKGKKADDKRKRSHSRQRTAIEVDIFAAIAAPCKKVRHRLDSNPIVLREADNSFFRNTLVSEASDFIIKEVDPIEVFDHININAATSRLLIRTTIPTQEEHDFVKTLKRQVDITTFQSVMEAAKKDNGLVLLAFTTIYMNDIAGRQQRVEQLIFHAFILVSRPISKKDPDMKVPVSWTSKAFNGSLLDRLCQIACILFWKSASNLSIKSTSSFRHRKILWKAPKESLLDIAIRVGGDQSRFTLTSDKRTWADNAMKKVNKMSQAIIENLEAFLRPTKEKYSGLMILGNTALVTEMKEVIVRMMTFPLSFFTHYLIANSQFIVDSAAELMQRVSISPAEATSSCDTDASGYPVNIRFEDWKFVMKCGCCGNYMNSPVDLVNLLCLGTRIIAHHYFGCDADDVILQQCLGCVGTKKIPTDFRIHPCVVPTINPPQNGVALCPETLMRMRFFDAIRFDNDMNEQKRHEKRICNTIGLTSALLPTSISNDTTLANSLVEMVTKLLTEFPIAIQTKTVQEPGDASLNAQHIEQFSRDIVQLRDERPPQVNITDIAVEPIAGLKSHESWDGTEEMTGPSSKREFAQSKSKTTFEVCNRVVEDGTLSAYTPRDGQGDEVLHMLSFLYAKHIVAIRKDMTYDALKNLVKGQVKIPRELQEFLKKYNIVSTSLVVITEIVKRKISPYLGELTPQMEAKLKWYIPTDFFLRLLPKDKIDSLYDGSLHYFTLSDDICQRWQQPILRSLKLGVSKLRLVSHFPNRILEINLSSGSNSKVFVDATNNDWMNNVQEPWLVELLSSLCYVSGSLGVTIGTGKKAPTPQSARYSPEGSNTWYDENNRSNQCVAGAIVNWLCAEGLELEALRMKEWAVTASVLHIGEHTMSKSLEYIKTHCGIANVFIRLTKPRLSLKETVNVVGNFPAPTILEFKFLSSHQTHSVVVSKNLVYDIQESHPYTFTESVLRQKLNADNDEVTLVGARYFHLLKQSKDIPLISCPSRPLDCVRDKVPCFRVLVQGLGKNKSEKRNRKRKRK